MVHEMLAMDMTDCRAVLACVRTDGAGPGIEWKTKTYCTYGVHDRDEDIPGDEDERQMIRHLRNVLTLRGYDVEGVVAAVPKGVDTDRLEGYAEEEDIALLTVDSCIADAHCLGRAENGRDLILHRCMNELICAEMEWKDGEPEVIEHHDTEFGWNRNRRNCAEELDRSLFERADRIVITGTDPHPDRFAAMLTDRLPEVADRVRVIPDGTCIGAVRTALSLMGGGE